MYFDALLYRLCLGPPRFGYKLLTLMHLAAMLFTIHLCGLYLDPPRLFPLNHTSVRPDGFAVSVLGVLFSCFLLNCMRFGFVPLCSLLLDSCFGLLLCLGRGFWFLIKLRSNPVSSFKYCLGFRFFALRYAQIVKGLTRLILPLALFGSCFLELLFLGFLLFFKLCLALLHLLFPFPCFCLLLLSLLLLDLLLLCFLLFFICLGLHLLGLLFLCLFLLSLLLLSLLLFHLHLLGLLLFGFLLLSGLLLSFFLLRFLLLGLLLLCLLLMFPGLRILFFCLLLLHFALLRLPLLRFLLLFLRLGRLLFGLLFLPIRFLSFLFLCLTLVGLHLGILFLCLLLLVALLLGFLCLYFLLSVLCLDRLLLCFCLFGPPLLCFLFLRRIFPDLCLLLCGFFRLLCGHCLDVLLLGNGLCLFFMLCFGLDFRFACRLLLNLPISIGRICFDMLLLHLRRRHIGGLAQSSAVVKHYLSGFRLGKP